MHWLQIEDALLELIESVKIAFAHKIELIFENLEFSFNI